MAEPLKTVASCGLRVASETARNPGGMTFAQIAAKEGISPTRVQQVFWQAMHKLQHSRGTARVGLMKARGLAEALDASRPAPMQEGSHE